MVTPCLWLSSLPEWGQTKSPNRLFTMKTIQAQRVTTLRNGTRSGVSTIETSGVLKLMGSISMYLGSLPNLVAPKAPFLYGCPLETPCGFSPKLKNFSGRRRTARNGGAVVDRQPGRCASRLWAKNSAAKPGGPSNTKAVSEELGECKAQESQELTGEET